MLPLAKALRERTDNDSSVRIPVFIDLPRCEGTAPLTLPHHRHFGFSQNICSEKAHCLASVHFGLPGEFPILPGVQGWNCFTVFSLLTQQGRQRGWLQIDPFWIKDNLNRITTLRMVGGGRCGTYYFVSCCDPDDLKHLSCRSTKLTPAWFLEFSWDLSIWNLPCPCRFRVTLWPLNLNFITPTENSTPTDIRGIVIEFDILIGAW